MLYTLWRLYAGAVTIFLFFVAVHEHSLFALEMGIGLSVVFVRAMRSV